MRLFSFALVAVGLLTLVVGGIATRGAQPAGERVASAQELPTPTPGPPFSTPLFIPTQVTGASIDMSIDEACIQILAGPCTNMWTYGGTFPGPTIRRPTGQTTDITFNHNLDASAGPLTVHHHGNHSSPEHDGQPHSYLIQPGDSRQYFYTHMEDGQPERGATQFYHDHLMDVTGRNVWNGLIGFYILDDPADPQTLPSGQYDIPLMVLDRLFDAQNQIPYNFNRNGVSGTTFLVNGTYQPFISVGDRKYRFRLLNASNARTHNYALSNGQTFQQIGTESGLLPAPVTRTEMRAGPAERLDVVVDFAGRLGETLYLVDTLSSTNLLEIRVNQDLPETSSVPPTLRPAPVLGTPTVTREFVFSSSQGQWTINGQIFDHNRFDAQPVRGSTEKWILKSVGATSHMIHIHDVDQMCIHRFQGTTEVACYPYEAAKESWFLGPNETVEVTLKFSDHVGPYVFHCHILEHEDDGMMSQFLVVDENEPTPTPTASATATATATPSPTATATNTPAPDSDGDTIADPDDNCLFVPNLDQANYDRNFIEMAPRVYDDVTRPMSDGIGDACDADADNDGRTNALEGALCPAASAPTDPLNQDSDGDIVLDGAECALGTDPNDHTSRPSPAQCGASTDADGDVIVAFREYCNYGTDPALLDSDGDGCSDGLEMASINADRTATIIDIAQIATGFGAVPLPAPLYLANFDVTKDTNINIIDLYLAATRFGQSC